MTVGLGFCRCGWKRHQGPHLCHRCHRWPGRSREYVYSKPTLKLSGVTLELKPIHTHTCDRCWGELLKELANLGG